LPSFTLHFHVAIHWKPFAWIEVEEKACGALKVLRSRAMVFQPQVFYAFVDALDVLIGSMLMQRYEKNWYRLVYYASGELFTAKKNYSTTEREALGMIYSVTKFHHYLLGKKFTFHVDHSAIVYFVSKVSLTGKLAKWTLLLQEYKFEIVHGLL
jgi:hypothetical protein